MELQTKTIKVDYKTDKWYDLRGKYIGGSDAGTILGVNPYKSNVDLWKEKTRLVTANNGSQYTNEFIEYGTNAEQYLTELFKLDYPCYEVIDTKEDLFIADNGFMCGSLDGLLKDKETGELGILEIKTANDIQGTTRKQWGNGFIPYQYYCQILHYFAVVKETTFAYIKCQIKYSSGEEVYCETLHRKILRSEVENDIKVLVEKEAEFWEQVKTNKMPPLKIA